MGTILAFFQLFGTTPVSKDVWNRIVKVSLSSFAHSFKSLPGMSSGPVALFSFMRVLTPFLVT